MRKPAAIYARVSSDRQREHETIASQTTALQAYADTHDYLVPPAWVFEDDGYSGATLVRPGLEALRDLAAAGQIDAALVYAPDRLSRKYAYQILLTEELARCGVSLVFLQSPPGTTPEDHLLLQVQGMIAEYERAQIAERTRRGKRHKAKRGVVNALSAAPYGYQYVRKSDHADAYYHVNETEAAMVRQVFEAYTREGLSINALARRLNERRVPTRTGARWERGTIWKMLRNPAYYGKACFGKTAARPRHRITRRLRLKGRVPSRDSANVARPRSEWVEIAVPPLISDETFALAQERLQQNKQYARRRTTTPTLLQGLLVCAQCGYSLYRQRVYYRCIGIDGYRHAHGPVCTNRPIRQDRLDALVWRELLRLLDDPTLIQAELDRRLDAARHAAPGRQRGDDLARQQARVAKSLDRLVTAYQQELVTLDELRDRIAPLRRQQHAIAAELHSLQLASVDQAHYLRLAETLAEFRGQLRARAETLDVAERQKILRLVIKEIRVGPDAITICHSLPGATPRPDQGGHKGPSSLTPNTGLGSADWLLSQRRQAPGLWVGEAQAAGDGGWWAHGAAHAGRAADAGGGHVVKTCLAKDPDDRWQSAGDVKRQVIWIGERASRSSEPTQTGFARRTWRPSVGAAVASLLIGAALAGITVWSLKPTAVRSLELVAFRTGDVPTGAVALSPDGMRVVFSSGSNPDAELSVHRLDELDATPLRGTQGGFAPFFSPDGEWVAFSNIRNGDLMRVPSVGGQPETICTCGMFPTLRGQSWGPDDTIVFGMEGSEGLWQVSAVGGEPELLTRVDPAQEMDHRHPWILPDGKAVLFTAWSGSDESSRIALASMETGEVSYLMAGSGAQYTQSGHVVYGAGRGILRAVGFDAERGELTSDNPVPVLENVAVFFGGMPPFSVSDTGSIAYVLGYGAGNPFVWVDSGGGEEPLGLPALLHLTFQLSPGDDRIAVEIDGIAGNSDISVYDLESGNLTQLTSSSERECCPLWSPDGARVVFTSWRGGAPNLYSTAADGSGSATRLTDDDLTQFAYGWLDGGTTLLLIQDDDLYALWPDGRSTPTRLLQTEWREERPTLSPNGRWIAFESERAGPRAVEVRALADVVDGSWWTVSPRETGTYDEALWSPDGRQLFFRSQTEMMVVPIDTGPQFRWGPPEPLFPYPGFIRMVGIGATMSLGMGVSLC